MPTYEYKCRDCGESLDVVQSFTDDALSVCPHCKGSLRKVFSPVGIAFKGNGFYKTDNRAANGKAKSETKSETKSESKSETNGSDTKSSDTKSTKDTKAAAKN